MSETIIGLFNAEVIYPRGLWPTFDDVEYGTLDWVDWFNNRRLLETIGHVLSGRVRTDVLPATAGSSQSGMTQTTESPGFPARFKLLHRRRRMDFPRA